MSLEHSESLQASINATLLTDYASWPPDLRRSSIAPIWEKRVSLEVLRGFLMQHPTFRPHWPVPDLGGPLFPKIAVCSWKCFPWLASAPHGTDLGAFCSHRMRTVLGCWLDAEIEPTLRFFPFIDYENVSEFRFLVRGNNLSLTRSTFRGKQSEDAKREKVRAAEFFLMSRTEGLDSYLVDVAVKKDDLPWVVEINPTGWNFKPTRKS